MGFGGKDSSGASGDFSSAAQAQIQAAQQVDKIATQYANQSLDTLQNYYNQAVGNLNSFYNQGLAQTTGYNLAGNTALDSLMQSMGMPVVQGGTYGFAQQALQLQKDQQQLAGLQNNQTSTSDLQQQIQQLLPGAQAEAQFLGGGAYGGSGNAASDIGSVQSYEQQFGGQVPGDLRFLQDVAGRAGSYQNIGTDANYAAQNLAQIQKLQQQYQQSQQQPTPAQVAQQQQLQSQITQLQAQQQNPTMVQTTNPLTGFANSGQGKLTGYDPNQSLIQNFQNTNPGYQFQQQQGQQAIKNSMAAQGLLNNPQLMTALDQYTTGLANQSFNSYQQNLQSAFGGYQQALANVASGGLTTGLANQQQAGNTGQNLSTQAAVQGQNVSNVYSSLGSTLSNSALAQGQALANQYMNQANLAQQNQAGAGMLGGLLGKGLGSMLGGSLGGPAGSAGALAGASAGGSIGGALGGALVTFL